MADTNNTNEEHIDGTRYIPIGEYDNLLKSYHELDGELQREVSNKKWFGAGAAILTLWGSAALVLSECDGRENYDSVSVDAGIYESEDDSYESEDSCYGPKTIGELKEKIGELEKKLEDCRSRNKELSRQPKNFPEKMKPAQCPPVKECPYIKQY